MYKYIMFPSLPVSTLYGTIILTWFDSVFRFAVITEYLLLKLVIYILHINISSSHSTSNASADLSKVVDFAALCTFIP